MNDMQGTAKGYRLIRDIPASEDQFDTHQRIADAMAATLAANPDLRTIGIVGPWGSGKSTVLRLFENTLSQGASLATVFTFDAWLHHGESVRRAFLESFLCFCNPAKKSVRDRLAAAADQVTGRSLTTETIDEPGISWGGLCVLASIAVGGYGVAKGHALRGVPWIREMLSWMPDWMPILLPGLVPMGTILGVALWRYCVAWRVLRALSVALFIAGLSAVCAGELIGRGFNGPMSVAGAALVSLVCGGVILARALTNAKRDYDASPADAQVGESILGLILSRQHQRKRTRVSGASTPTAVEFADVFRAAVTSTFGGQRRLVVVIDNLDRLPEAEAKEVWAMLRTFFAATVDADVAIASTPIVVVPVAEEAVDAIFKVDGESRTQSFMDKTFDVTFYLPRPVLTGWQDYLAGRMREVFDSELVADWVPQTTRLVDAKYAAPSSAITPRALNTLVNHVATVWLQNCAFNIPFATVVYYCLHRGGLDRTLTAPNNIVNVAVDVYDPDWQRNLAALHFGVAPEKAIHVLLDGPIRRSIAGRDVTGFSHWFSIPGAQTIILRLFSAYRDDAATDKARVLNSVHVLAHVEAGNSPRPEFWLLLANVLRGVSWDTLTGDDVTDLLTLLDHIPGHESELLTAVQQGLGAITRPDIVAPQIQARLWTEAYGRKPMAFNGVAPIQVIGPASAFLDVMELVDATPGLRLRMTYASPPDVMKELLASLASSENGVVAERRYLAAKDSALELDWSSHVNQCAGLVRTAGTASSGNDQASIERLRTPLLSLVADGQESRLIAGVTDALHLKLSWVLSSAISNASWDVAGYAMAAASTHSLTGVDSSIAPPDDVWPAIATAYLRAMVLSGIDPAGGMSAIPAPEQPAGTMRLSYKRLMAEVSVLIVKAKNPVPARTIGPASVQPPN